MSYLEQNNFSFHFIWMVDQLLQSINFKYEYKNCNIKSNFSMVDMDFFPSIFSTISLLYTDKFIEKIDPYPVPIINFLDEINGKNIYEILTEYLRLLVDFYKHTIVYPYELLPNSNEYAPIDKSTIVKNKSITEHINSVNNIVLFTKELTFDQIPFHTTNTKHIEMRNKIIYDDYLNNEINKSDFEYIQSSNLFESELDKMKLLEKK